MTGVSLFLPTGNFLPARFRVALGGSKQLTENSWENYSILKVLDFLLVHLWTEQEGVWALEGRHDTSSLWCTCESSLLIHLLMLFQSYLHFQK